MSKHKKKRKTDSSPEFAFRSADNIGYADAHDDLEYLLECFVDTGQLVQLSDLDEAKRIVVGRTGCGKTALLEKLKDDNSQHTLTINAEDLALGYVANSEVLKALQGLGVRLDPFFRLLWRHVIAVAVLQKRFKLQGGEPRSAWRRLFDRFKHTSHLRALEYIETWGGDRFWQETQIRVKEITSKFETDVQKAWSADLNIRAISGKASMQSGEKLTTEQRAEIVDRGQRVVNEVHLKEMSRVIEWIRDVLEESQEYYYVIIDRLDENWVDDEIRYRMIRALIETAREFQKAKRCKVILAAREDLLARVYEATADAGFQEEKYKSTYVNVRWTKVQLARLVELRVNSLLRRRYTKQPLTLADVLPPRIDGQVTMEYLLDRTLLRPRDVISFVNHAITNSDGSSRITVRAVKQAEDAYSIDRLNALRDEWAGTFPDLASTWQLLRGRMRAFDVDEVRAKELGEVALECAVRPQTDSPIWRACTSHVSAGSDVHTLRQAIIAAWYRVGVVGLKLDPSEHVLWSYRGDRAITASEIVGTSRICIHKFAASALGIRDNKREMS